LLAANTFIASVHTSINELVPGSTELNTLNGQIGSEPAAKTSIGFGLLEGYLGGPVVLMESPQQADADGNHFIENGYFMTEDAAFIFESLLDDPSYWAEKSVGAAAMITLGWWMMNWSVDYSNNVIQGFPHDGFIAQSAELYPWGAQSLAVTGMSHVQETTLAVSYLANWILANQ
jgi:hypothetical protein